MFVKPKSGLKVRDPETKGFLPEEGAEVPDSLYWTRRLRDKSVVVATPPAASPAPKVSPMPREEARK